MDKLYIGWLAKKIWHHWKHADVKGAIQCIDMGIGYSMSWGEATIQPTDLGIRLMAIWSEYVIAPYMLIRQHFCKHPNWVDEGYGGPDSGCDAGYCPDCGFSYHHVMY